MRYLEHPRYGASAEAPLQVQGADAVDPRMTQALTPPPGRTGFSLEQLTSLLVRSPFTTDFLKTSVVRLGAGEVELTVPIRPDLTQHHGFVHGAVIACAGDDACCWAACSLVGDVVTAEYSLRLVAPARGERLIARGKVDEINGRRIKASARVYAVKQERETLVAEASAMVVAV